MVKPTSRALQIVCIPNHPAISNCATQKPKLRHRVTRSLKSWWLSVARFKTASLCRPRKPRRPYRDTSIHPSAAPFRFHAQNVGSIFTPLSVFTPQRRPFPYQELRFLIIIKNGAQNAVSSFFRLKDAIQNKERQRRGENKNSNCSTNKTQKEN